MGLAPDCWFDPSSRHDNMVDHTNRPRRHAEDRATSNPEAASHATGSGLARELVTPLRHEALQRCIGVRLAMCSFDELRVLDVILERVLKLGRESYAPLDLARDDRDWSAEAAAELADTLFYLAARDVAANDRRLERLRCEAADELTASDRVEHGLRELRNARIDEPHIDLGGEGG